MGDNPQLLLDKKTEQKIEEYRKVLTPLFTDMMSAVFNQKGAQLDINIIASPQAQALIGAHAGILDSSFKQVEMSEAMRRRLSRSNHIFSGMKVAHELNEGHLSLLDENGNRKPFERFLNDVRKIDKTYNKNYLQAEYQFIHSSAIMAAKWEEFSKTGDRYLLRYRTVGDNRVRPAHAALHGVTLPMSDPFWEQHYPPNGWRCRCDVVQVRRGKYPVTDHDEAMALGEEAMGTDTSGMFRFNPGIEKKTVPDYNPYTIRRCRDCDIAKGKTTLAFVPDNELCAACRLIRQSQQARTNQRLTPQEFRQATAKAVKWADENLTLTVINNHPAKRSFVQTKDGHTVGVGKVFFTETAAKSIRDPNMVHVLKTATEFKKWLPQATLVRTEEGRHHNFQFSVYQVEYQGQLIEFKCKKTDGELLYMMKFI